MKQIITLFLFLFVFTSQSFAVKSTVVVTGDDAVISVDQTQSTGIFSKIANFVSKTTDQVINAVNSLGGDTDIILIVLALFIPPLAMWMYEGETWTKRCTINLILTFLAVGWIHALYIILTKK